METSEPLAGRPHTELKNRHAGEDIWVLASGPSMNFVDPSFFTNKITIGVNRIVKQFRCQYVVTKDSVGLPEILPNLAGATLIVSKHEYGELDCPEAKIYHDHYVFTHPAKVDQAPTLECVGGDAMFLTFASGTSPFLFGLALDQGLSVPTILWILIAISFVVLIPTLLSIRSTAAR